MRLKELCQHETIWIQCHDNPDADALASGFALYRFFQAEGKKVRLVYSGRREMTKSNLCLMVEELGIPVEYVAEQKEEPELLVMADCQYGEGNVSSFTAKEVAVIDHHQVSRPLPMLSEVRSNLGACSTLVYDMIKRENPKVLEDKKLMTALYYGLMTDTNQFTEISHPLDRDLRDEAEYDRPLITLFCNSNLSLEELKIAGEALSSYEYHEEHRYAMVEAKPCDPNILGIISDMTLEVDAVDCCLVYSILPFGIKLSIRSCKKETKASELAEYLTEGIGSGGGHLEKAGGFIQRESFEQIYQGTLWENHDSIKEKLMGLMETYFADTEVIYAKEYHMDQSKLTTYQKKNVKLGYVKGTDMFAAGTEVTVRTLEGDLEIKIQDDIYIMIGIMGEVYPNQKEKFFRGNQCLEEPYVFDGEYAPSVKLTAKGENVSLIPYAKSCIATGGVKIRAMQLDHRVKVFTAWDESKYMLGKPGDYLACREDDLQDIYVIENRIFQKTYE